MELFGCVERWPQPFPGLINVLIGIGGAAGWDFDLKTPSYTNHRMLFELWGIRTSDLLPLHGEGVELKVLEWGETKTV